MFWNKTTNATTEIGKQSEQLASEYLIKNGLTIIEKNFHCRFGEIDIIAKDSQTIIFIEVKYRSDVNYGGAISAVSASKQEKIKKSARIYLQQQALNEYNTACRFDVIAMQGQLNSPEITWLTNAF